MEKKKKIALLNNIESMYNTYSTIVVIDANKISANDSYRLRAILKKEGVKVKFIKNSIAKIACKKNGYESIAELLKGSSFLLACSKDTSSCTKAIKSFMSNNDNVINVTGGIADGKTFTHKDFEKIASLPSKDELIETLKNLIYSPINALVKVKALPLMSINKINSTLKA